MIKVKNIAVSGWEAAIRGMRNPLNSWDKSDTYYECEKEGCSCIFGDAIIGPNDLNLMKKLYNAGTEHRKYLRMIIVTMDITAPLYWWKEFDTYKVGTVANSCSTMHKIHDKEFTIDDFSHEHLLDREDEKLNWGEHVPLFWLEHLIIILNENRKKFLETKDKIFWWQLIQLLPSSYNQRRTVQMNYENVVTMIKHRTDHKLDEWQEFVKILKELPHIKEIVQV